MSQPTATGEAAATPDGRSSRWAAHRTQKRAEIVDAAIRAIRRHGASVGMDEIAAEAGTSKTVVYRHLRDKASLYLAVVERTNDRVVANVAAAMGRSPTDPCPTDDPIALVASTVEAYLSLIESDAELYRFIVHRPNIALPQGENPVHRTVGAVTDLIADSLAECLASDADDARQLHRIRVAAVAIVGSVDAVADDWLSQPERLPREQVVSMLTDLAARGLGPLLRQDSRR